MDTLLQTVNEQELISAALAFARSETSEAYALAKTPIGSVELHRREEAYKTFSFSYFHILMEKGKDGYE
ncbi:MAG: hypothetical protein LBP53_04720 [Candidatus Peribacteria bacterium]|jgi:hypothetical protein|nr:hypothetical protein [Candidatus Peribacteria bacterium]